MGDAELGDVVLGDVELHEPDDAWLLGLEPLLTQDANAAAAEASRGSDLGCLAAAGNFTPSSAGTSSSSVISGAQGSSTASKSRRRAQNTEACRRHRNRKREETVAMRERNAELEAKRHMYLARIAALQEEVNALRYGGTVDLAKENELMRAEIKRHKAFIRRIVKVAKVASGDWPEPMSDEERLGLVRAGVQGAKCQMLGNLYSSACDPAWTESPVREVAGRSVRLRFQFLPANCPREEAQRLQLRIDYIDMPFSMAVVSKVIESLAARDASSTKVYDDRHEAHTRTRQECQDIFPEELKQAAALLGDDTKLHMMRVLEHDLADTDAKPHEVLIAGAEGLERNLPFCALFPDSSPAVAGVPQGHLTEAFFSCFTNFDAGLAKAQVVSPDTSDESQRYSAPFSQGFIVVPSATAPEDRTHMSNMNTLPINADSLPGFRRSLGDGSLEAALQAFDEDGMPSPTLMALCTMQVTGFHELLQMHAEAAASQTLT